MPLNTNTNTNTLKHLLPPNLTPLEQALAEVILEQFDALPINTKRQLWNANTCPTHLLPWLAWSLGLESWDNTWQEAIKRKRIKQAIPIARRKGTVGSIRRLLQSYGGSFAIKEWWQKTPKGEPHTFELIITLSNNKGDAHTGEMIAAVIRDIDVTKPARSHYTATQGVLMTSSLPVVASVRSVMIVNLEMCSNTQPTRCQTALSTCNALRGGVMVSLSMTLQ